MDAPFRGFLSAYFVACGARYPRTPGVQGLLSGMGAFCAPTQALFHTHLLFFPAPGFFFFFGPWGHASVLDSLPSVMQGGWTDEVRALLREFPESPRGLLDEIPLTPNFVWFLGGNAVHFFRGCCAGDFPFHFQSSVFLSFFLVGFSGMNFGL